MAIIGAASSLGGLSGGNTLARLIVVVTGDSTGLTKAMAQAEGSVAGLQKNAGAVGNTLTRNLTLPLLALGGGAVKLALDFNTAVAKVQALTPIAKQTGDTFQQLSDKILALASDPQVVAGPTDLANALYFAGSAGLNASTAFNVTKLAAQGQSIGMGDAADVAKILIAALNNYPRSALTATQAMDTLTAAIKAGTAEPNELAIALGRLLPIASEAGVTFQQVAGSVAALTNLGVPTRVATTSLRALFGELLTPTQQAITQLNELGLSADDLRGALENGPVAAFKLLLNATHGNIDALHEIIPQIRGFTAFLGATRDHMKQYKQALDEVNNSQGAFKHALDIISKTPQFQFEKAIQSLKIAGIDLGEKLIPVFLKIVDVVKQVAEIFTSIPGAGQTALAGLLVVGAAIGPILKLYAALTKVREVQTASGLTLIAPTFKAIALQAGVAAVALTIAFGAFKQIASGQGGLVTFATAAIAGFVGLKFAITAVQQAISAVASEKVATGFLQGFLGLGAGEITAIAAAITAVGLAIAYVVGKSHAIADAARELNQAFGQAATSGGTFTTAIQGIKDTGLADNLRKMAGSMQLLNKQVNTTNLDKFREGIGVQLTASIEKFRGSMDALSRSEIPSGLLTGMEQLISDGKDLGKVNVDQLLNALGDAKQLATENGDFGAAINAAALEQLVLDYNAAGSAQKQLAASTSGLIDSHTQEGAAIDQLAHQYGVSTDFMTQKLSELGVTAQGVLAGNQTDFQRAAFGIDKFGNDVSGAAAEAKAALTDMANATQESLRSGFDPFADAATETKKSVDQLVQQYQRNSHILEQESRNIVTLQKKGLPSGLISQLQSAGPDVLDKFAHAAPQKLRQIQSAYAIGLAATDAEIVKEGLHQEVKGKNMVEGFALAIEKSSSLPRKSAQKLIGQMQQAFNKGTLTPAGLKKAREFVTGLGHVTNLTPKIAAQATSYFLKALQQKGNYNKAGQLIASRVAQGMHQSLHIPVQQAKQMVHSVTTNLDNAPKVSQEKGALTAARLAEGITSSKPKAKTAAQGLADGAKGPLTSLPGAGYANGLSMGEQLAAGIEASRSAAVAAAQATAAAVKAAMHNAMTNSPEYFTYYMGQELGKQLGAGMDKGIQGLRTAQPHVSPRVKGAGRGAMEGHLTITNWDEGTGHFRAIAADEGDIRGRYDVRLARRTR